MGPADPAELLRALDPQERRKAPNVALVGPAGVGVGQIGEPLDFRGYRLELGKLAVRQLAPCPAGDRQGSSLCFDSPKTLNV